MSASSTRVAMNMVMGVWACLAATAAADPGLHVGVWGGWTAVDAKDFNDALGQLDGIVAGAGGTVVKKDLVHAGLEGGLEVGWPVQPNAVLALRTGLLKLDDATYEAAAGATRLKIDATAMAVPVMLGGRHETAAWDPLVFSLGLFAGVAPSSMSVHQQAIGGAAPYDYTLKAGGLGFVLESTLGVGLRLGNLATASVDVGWRSLKTPLRFTADVPDANGDGQPEAIKDHHMRDPADTRNLRFLADGILTKVRISRDF